MMAIPFAIFGALGAIWLRGIDNDIYFEIGLVTLVSLAAKNAVLIVDHEERLVVPAEVGIASDPHLDSAVRRLG